jgi:putative endonuclease
MEPARRTRSQVAGDDAESAVVAALRDRGWTILARNVHVGRAEIDIVALDPFPPASLVIVEVRWRRVRDFGLPEETVDWRKRDRLHRAGFALADAGQLPNGVPLPRLPLRFDLIVVEPGVGPAEPRIRHHRAAL